VWQLMRWFEFEIKILRSSGPTVSSTQVSSIDKRLWKYLFPVSILDFSFLTRSRVYPTSTAFDLLEGNLSSEVTLAQKMTTGFLRNSLRNKKAGVDLAIAPYCGKETGETALLHRLREALRPGDVFVADSF
jgi:hypothetical protein